MLQNPKALKPENGFNRIQDTKQAERRQIKREANGKEKVAQNKVSLDKVQEKGQETTIIVLALGRKIQDNVRLT